MSMIPHFRWFAIMTLVVGLGAACATPIASGATIPLGPRAGAHPALGVLPPFRDGTEPGLASVPDVFINIGTTTDRTGLLSRADVARLTATIEDAVASTGYATRWPGPLPTSTELDTSRTRAFAVAATVTQVELMPSGDGASISCRVSVTISRWTGTDGDERWAADTTAFATGSGRVTAGPGRDQQAEAIQDCTHRLIEDITSRQVLPFLRRVAATE